MMMTPEFPYRNLKVIRGRFRMARYKPHFEAVFCRGLWTSELFCLLESRNFSRSEESYSTNII